MCGRKRKSNKERWACGKISSPDREIPSANHIRRAIGQAIIAGRDPWLGTRLGWLAAKHEITSHQAEAGFAFAKLADLYAQTIGLPDQKCSSVDLDRVPGRGMSVIDEKRITDVRRRYTQIIGKLECLGADRVVIDVCVHDRAPEWYERKALHQGLRILTVMFGLIPKGMPTTG